jgi:hypothetical protein
MGRLVGVSLVLRSYVLSAVVLGWHVLTTIELGAISRSVRVTRCPRWNHVIGRVDFHTAAGWALGLRHFTHDQLLVIT